MFMSPCKRNKYFISLKWNAMNADFSVDDQSSLTCCQVDQFYFHRFSEQINSFFILIYKNENKKIKLWNIHHQFGLKLNINKGKIIFNLSSFDVNSFKRLKCKLIILKQKKYTQQNWLNKNTKKHTQTTKKAVLFIEFCFHLVNERRSISQM